MTILRLGRPTQRIVKSYGRDSLLVWINPILSAIQATLGLRVGPRSEAEVLDRMQKDAITMAERGYRVIASDEYDLPTLLIRGSHAHYYRVTYELKQPAKRRLRSQAQSPKL